MSGGSFLMALLYFSKPLQTLISISPVVLFISWIVRNLFDAIKWTWIVKHIMLRVPSKAFNHCFLTLKSCKEPIFFLFFGGGGGHFWQEIVYMCSAPLHSVCHHLWLLSTLRSDLLCKTLTVQVDGRFEVSVDPSPLVMPMWLQRAMWWWTAVISGCHLCLCQQGLAWSGRGWMLRGSFSKHVPDVPFSLCYIYYST